MKKFFDIYVLVAALTSLVGVITILYASVAENSAVAITGWVLTLVMWVPMFIAFVAGLILVAIANVANK